MRIAMMTNNYKPIVGGVSISIDRLSTALRKRGHEVTVFAPSYPHERAECSVVRYGNYKHQLDNGMVIPTLYDPKIDDCFHAMHYDLIHVHHPMLIGYTALRLSRKYNIPLAFTYHTRYEQYLHHIKLYAHLQEGRASGAGLCRRAQRLVIAHNRAFTNACDLIFAPTPLIREFLGEHGTIRPVVVMPTGLDEKDFLGCTERAHALRIQFARQRKHLFCSVSRLEKEKNISFLLRALALFRQQHGDCFRMLFLGDGSFRKRLEQEAAELGIAGNIEFVGTVEHSVLADYYRACDLFLFASRSETQGIVLLEAMAAGLPVVAVEASGVCDIVKDGRNGWISPHDEAAFCSRLAGIFSAGQRFGRLQQGAQLTAHRYTAAQMAVTAEENYEWMIVERRLQSGVGIQPTAGLRIPVGIEDHRANDSLYSS